MASSSSDDSPNTMAPPQSDAPPASSVPHEPPQRRPTITSEPSTTGTANPDICRICRSEGTSAEPLFHPCKCAGSMKYVHQDCLIEWLGHSHKKHCELCKTPFRFTKLYDAHMPSTLPWGVFARRAAWHVVKGVVRGSRLALVGFVWFGLIPWVVRWVWRWLFWLADAAWSREAFMGMMKEKSEKESSGPGLNWLQEFFAPVNGSAVELGPQQPFMMRLAQNIGLIDPSVTSNATSMLPDEPSMLSDWTYLSTMTDSRRMNRFILDVFEGQLITCVILTSFILVFLLREWVVQQQPLANVEGIDNAQNQLRDAAARLQADNERLVRQEELLEQARQRLLELQSEAEALPGNVAFEADKPTFDGWESLEKLIEETTQHLRQDGELDHDLFLTGAAGVAKQIRAAGQAGENLDEFTDKVYQKFASYPAAERREWEGVIVGEIEKSALKRPGPTVQQRDAAGESLGEAADRQDRPAMPSRDLSSRTLHIQRLLHEVDDAFPTGEGPGAARRRERRDRANLRATNTAASQPAETSGAESEASIAALPSLQQHSTQREEQPGKPSRFDSIPIANAGPDARITVRRSEFVNDSGKIVQPVAPRIEERMLTEDELKKRLEAEVAKELEAEKKKEQEPPADAEPETSEDQTTQNDHPFHPDGPEPSTPSQEAPERRDSETFGGRVASAFREEFGLDEAEELEDLRQMGLDADGETAPNDGNIEPAQPRREGDPEPNFIEMMMECLWGDVHPPGAQEPALPAREEIQAADDQRGEGEQGQGQEAPFVPVQNGQPQPHDDDDDSDAEEAHDQEDIAAAEQALNNAEAVEDAEDLEGIFELIGVQGPLIGLFQTSAFCMLLVGCTIIGAVFAPYVWGKVCLSLVANPVYFVIVMPLQILSFVADVVIDSSLMIGGWTVMVFALAMNWTLSGVKAFVPALGTGKLCEQLVRYSGTAASKAGGKLANLVVKSAGSGGDDLNWAFLAASVHAHASLQTIQEEIRAVLDFTGHTITGAVNALSSGTVTENLISAAKSLPSFTTRLLQAAKTIPQDIQPVLTFLTDLSRGRLHFTRPAVSLDPTLVYWSTPDRGAAIFAGYAALATLAAIYVALDTPITSTPTGRKREKQVRDSLRQAGGVLKVILIISIEMLVFPLYCGLLLDLAFLPLFQGVSVSTRWQYALSHPWGFCFVHWFVGTCYMFHFALFVSMCRKILRKGVLWFIRDPDDPNFHPVRDVLEKNVLTQLRKIAFSALVYGALVILCLGGVIWSIGQLFRGIFPLQWTSTEPILEFPLDLLLYIFATPLVIRVFKPSDIVQEMYAWWLRHCARLLRLSHFLFDDRKKDEERSGTYVLTPCNDSYRPPKPNEAWLHADGEDVYIADRDGKRNEHFAKVFVPPYFRVRVALFMVCLWAFSAVMGLCGTLVPLVFGRAVFKAMVGGQGLWVNDIYSYIFGAYVLGGVGFAALNAKKGVAYAKERASTLQFKAAVERVNKFTARALRCAYVYGFLGVVFPLLMALTLHCYIVLPLATWSLSHKDELSGASMSAMGDTFSPDSGRTNTTTLLTPAEPSGMGTLADHTLHLLQEHALGILYVRILSRVILTAPTSRAAEAFRRVTANGYLDPDPRLATRYFIFPFLLLSLILLAGPPALASIIPYAYPAGLKEEAKGRMYRYSYAGVAVLGLVGWGLRAVARATARWRMRVRDEVYLVGERLHNFGEVRPPVGTRSVAVRKGR